MGNIVIVPIETISDSEYNTIVKRMYDTLKGLIVTNIATIQDASKVVVRPLVVGDPNHPDKIVDIGIAGASSGQIGWLIPAASITPNKLSEIFASGAACPDEKMILIFGFIDRTPNPDLKYIQVAKGKDIPISHDVEHIYRKGDINGGLFFDESGTPTYISYKPKDEISWKMVFETSADKEVQLLALIGEKLGETINKFIE